MSAARSVPSAERLVGRAKRRLERARKALTRAEARYDFALSEMRWAHRVQYLRNRALARARAWAVTTDEEGQDEFFG